MIKRSRLAGEYQNRDATRRGSKEKGKKPPNDLCLKNLNHGKDKQKKKTVGHGDLTFRNKEQHFVPSNL